MLKYFWLIVFLIISGIIVSHVSTTLISTPETIFNLIGIFIIPVYISFIYLIFKKIFNK